MYVIEAVGGIVLGLFLCYACLFQKNILIQKFCGSKMVK